MCSFAADYAEHRDWWRQHAEEKYREMTDQEVAAMVDAFLAEEIERRSET